jgi:hypothetical protein
VVWWRSLSGVCFLVALGCSSSNALTASPTAASAGASGQELHDHVLASCTDYASRSCASAAACCTQVYGAYDAQACVGFFVAQECEPAADAVQSGFATYDDSAVEPCLAAYAQADAVCVHRRGIRSSS